MYLVSTFHHSFEVELLLNRMEEAGVTRQNIMVLPLNQDEWRVNRISATSTGGSNILDIPLAIGTATMLLGVIYGYVLYLGPVLWGLFGLVGGTLGTLGVVSIAQRKSKKHGKKSRGGSEILILLRCDPSEERMLKELIKDFVPHGYAKLDIPGGDERTGAMPNRQ
ncbi:hypothetical protein [Paenibacillus silviterrae]|uniref:hypothetical protein n=1 Tax=Paenibacillus silviterrae TaxID=3242194 RepID=UPI002543B3F4|nr:hypothetical protein [Paenibacillus chinjuensis]